MISVHYSRFIYKKNEIYADSDKNLVYLEWFLVFEKIFIKEQLLKTNLLFIHIRQS